MRVPAGKFVMGSKYDNELASDDEKPQHTFDINYEYWIGKFIFTNEQYTEYLGKEKHPVSDWQNKKDHPVANVSWNDAMEFCKWFNETFKSDLGDLLLRLPTEAEWEKAARGAYGNEWPWGSEFNKTKCNTNEGGKDRTTPVGAYSALNGDAPYGCADMVGNVWEWTHSLFQKYPYQSNDGREDEIIHSTRVLRGGSFSNTYRNARCAFRVNYGPNFRNFYLGFRLCVSPLSYA